VSEGHKTTKNILEQGVFTVSMATAPHTAACDYLGIESGNRVPDKLARAGFHVSKSEVMGAPLIDELPMALECRLISYDPEACRLVGEIVNVCADESVLDAEGNIDPAKLMPITYDSMNKAYLVLGERVGTAYSDGKKFK